MWWRLVTSEVVGFMKISSRRKTTTWAQDLYVSFFLDTSLGIGAGIEVCEPWVRRVGVVKVAYGRIGHRMNPLKTAEFLRGGDAGARLSTPISRLCIVEEAYLKIEGGKMAGGDRFW